MPTQEVPTKEVPTFTLVRFNPRRAARGAEAAKVKIIWPDGDTEELWMSRADIRNNLNERGPSEGLSAALNAYKANKQFP